MGLQFIGMDWESKPERYAMLDNGNIVAKLPGGDGNYISPGQIYITWKS